MNFLRIGRLATALMVLPLSMADAQTQAPVGKHGEMASIDYQIIDGGAQSGIEDSRQEVLNDEASYKTLWAAHTAGVNPAPSPPVIDFSRYTLIAIFAGNQPTRGHSLAVTRLSPQSGGRVLNLTLSKPAPDCLVTQAITQPWMLIRMAKPNQPVRFHIEPVTQSCGP